MLKFEDNEILTRVGPGTPAGTLFRRFWLPALMPQELPHADCDPVRLRILGEDLVAFRDTEGRIGIVAERCPHRRASLYYGRNEMGGLRCVYHGWKFGHDGQCLETPGEPADSTLRHRIRQIAYPAREHGGFIWIYMGQPELQPELPRYEWAGLAPSHRWNAKWLYEANYAQGLEAEVDSAHTGFLHDTSTPASDLTAGMAQAATYWATDKAPKITVQPTDYGYFYGSRRNYPDGRYYWRLTQWLLPSFAIIPMPHWPVACRAYVPIDDEKSWVFNVSYNPEAPLTAEDLAPLEAGLGPCPRLIPGTFLPELNARNEYGLDREVQRTRNYTGIYGINNQDRAIVESMGPLTDRWNEHLGTSDLAVVAFRRRLIEFAKAAAAGDPLRATQDPGLYAVRPLDMICDIADMEGLVARHGDLMRAPA